MAFSVTLTGIMRWFGGQIASGVANRLKTTGGSVSLAVTVVEQVEGAVCPFDAETTTTWLPFPKGAVKVTFVAVRVPPGAISFVWRGMPSTDHVTWRGRPLVSMTPT